MAAQACFLSSRDPDKTIFIVAVGEKSLPPVEIK